MKKFYEAFIFLILFYFICPNILLAQDKFLDKNFGVNGIVRQRGSASTSRLQNDGKIVVAGQAYNKYILNRFNSEGSLDSDFLVLLFQYLE